LEQLVDFYGGILMSTLDIKKFVSECSPFVGLNEDEIESISLAIDIFYFKKGSIINNLLEYYYVVAKGVIKETIENEEIFYSSKDSFSFEAIFQKSINSSFEVVEEAIVYGIKKEPYLYLLTHNSNFANYFMQSKAKKLESMSEKSKTSYLTMKISNINLREPITIDYKNSIFETVKLMDKYRTNYVLINFGDSYGIVTDSNIRKAIINKINFDDPIETIAITNLITIDRDDFLFNAILKMTKHNIKRIAISENNKIVSIISDMDILSAFSNQTQFISIKIDRAVNINEIKSIANDLIKIVQNLNNDGIKTRSQPVSLLSTKNKQAHLENQYHKQNYGKLQAT
jgi:CBS domain-containing protein